MNKANYQLFIDQASFTPILAYPNNTSGFFEFEVSIPDLYFVVFHANNTTTNIKYQISQYKY
ncbi:MAG: hypothetical protein ACFFE4_14640 [Candidatus Thorarchaeota archaeon]